MAILTPTLRNGNLIKERQLLFGPPKIGKTHQLFTIALWHQNEGSDARFYGLNNDTSWDVVASNPMFSELDNIEWQDCNNMQDYYDHARRYHKRLREQDWLVLDLAEVCWQHAQDEYARALADSMGINIEDMSDLWVADEAPRGDDGKPKYPLEGWDWGMPNARYRNFAGSYIMRGPGHRMVIAGTQGVLEPTAKMKEREDDTAKKARQMFKHLGVKPAGQKDDPFRYHTILYIDGNEAEKTQVLATAGERWGNRRWMGRRHKGGAVTPEPIQDYFLDYLVGVAGWEIV